MSQKEAESIWTKDITPHVVNFLTMDITPDFSSELWTKDVTHHIIGTLAVFGLVVSSFVTVVGVTSAGVNVELALAQQASAPSQTAAATLAEAAQPVPTAMPVASSTPPFCPKISRTIGRGSDEGTTTGDVGQLQQFIANHFALNPQDVVTGHFGSTTQGYLEKFQEEQGIPTAPTAGPLTRAAIARLCGQPAGQAAGQPPMGGGRDHMGSTTMMGTTTPPMPPAPPRSDDQQIGSSSQRHSHPVMPVPPPSTPPVSYTDTSSNAANVLEAVSEIGDGYGRLLTASLKMFGL